MIQEEMQKNKTVYVSFHPSGKSLNKDVITHA